MRRTIFISITLICQGFNVYAKSPRVISDILPVHALVSQVMEGVDEPTLLLEPGIDPHHVSLKPSDARALSQADIVFWVGAELTPWLDDSLAALAPNALKIAWIDSPDMKHITASENHHDNHDHDAHNKHDDDHDDHHDHDSHDKHDDDHHDGRDHDAHDEHTGIDPHIWLDVDNAKKYLTYIQKILGDYDPQNAATYKANAEKAKTALTAQKTRMAKELSELPKRPILITHEALAYFENMFDIPPSTAIRDIDGNPPSPKRLAALRAGVKKAKPACLLVTPEDTESYTKLFTELEVKLVGVDQLGSTIAAGKDHYGTLLESLSTAYQTCLSL